MEKREKDCLLRLLRAELTAVHQQFIHMLALRQWQRGEILERITAIDAVDFKNVMHIIDHLAAHQVSASLPSHQIWPGHDVASILSSELRMEQHMASVIDELDFVGGETRPFIDRAAGARGEYRNWLEIEIRRHEPVTCDDKTSKAVAALLAELIALVEQSMMCAFMLWHSGRKIEADNAWRLSGASMLYGTALIKRAAYDGWMPAPSVSPEVLMPYTPEEAFGLDMILVRRCAEMGQEAAKKSGDDAISRICLRISEDCDLMLDMQADGEFPAVFGRSPVFESFAATLEKHL
ncbi:hypothetical protein [Ovoidimarina sediminis]|uniref:hypothetical protein n=1 Tax=Ovoidimarina sediminis TaxID=3079856 RepID=UPI0029114A19|nr:hypothetical protein [Rhodophyticola sp. MJ-SS7]MDU8946369.1 hypothetical protein [Rhodophyticola sp. MJ-SS7]